MLTDGCCQLEAGVLGLDALAPVVVCPGALSSALSAPPVVWRVQDVGRAIAAAASAKKSVRVSEVSDIFPK